MLGVFNVMLATSTQNVLITMILVLSLQVVILIIFVLVRLLYFQLVTILLMIFLISKHFKLFLSLEKKSSVSLNNSSLLQVLIH